MTAEDFCSFENLWRQYRACRRNKRNAFNALGFEVDAEANPLPLRADLLDHTTQSCGVVSTLTLPA